MSTKPCKLNIQLLSNKTYEIVYNNQQYRTKDLPSSLFLKTLCHKEFIWPSLFIRLHISSLKHFSVLLLPALALQSTTNHNYVIKTKHLSSR
jgi:hypothetical protein